MAYPKITVNTGLSLEVIASDTLPIPSPSLPVLSGTTTAATTDKLVDVGADFSNVNVGDIVYNTTDNTSASVVAIDSSTILEVSADIFTSPEAYTITDKYYIIQFEIALKLIIRANRTGESGKPLGSPRISNP